MIFYLLKKTPIASINLLKSLFSARAYNFLIISKKQLLSI